MDNNKMAKYYQAATEKVEFCGIPDEYVSLKAK